MRATAPCTMTGVSTGSRLQIMTTPNEALRTILPIAGWGDTQAADVMFTGGADPVLPTPFRIGAAGAATLAKCTLSFAFIIDRAIRPPRRAYDAPRWRVPSRQHAFNSICAPTSRWSPHRHWCPMTQAQE